MLNLPIYNFPETRFARENSPARQLDHVMSEVEEIKAEQINPEAPLEKMIEEIVDLTHSLETYWRILERIFGKEYVAFVFAQVEQKNRDRGYYTGNE